MTAYRSVRGDVAICQLNRYVFCNRFRDRNCLIILFKQTSLGPWGRFSLAYFECNGIVYFHRVMRTEIISSNSLASLYSRIHLRIAPFPSPFDHVDWSVSCPSLTVDFWIVAVVLWQHRWSLENRIARLDLSNPRQVSTATRKHEPKR